MSACPSIVTGSRFLARVLENIDCQAQVIGSYGYQALGEPGSLASLAMTSLLTLFVALFGLRLMFGPGPGVRDVVFDVAKVGIVLTLAFSWPAYRTVVYDVVLKGPAEVATAIGTPGGEARFTERLQRVDNAIVNFSMLGTGRYSPDYVGSQSVTFIGSSLEDENSLGWARLAYLAGIIGSLALLRIIAALLLAVAPLAAGLLLFEATRGLFAGWLKGLVLAMTGAIGVSLVLSVELAVLEPWLRSAMAARGAGYATLSAPVELFALTLAFTAAQFGVIWLLAKVAFNRGWASALALPAPRVFTETIRPQMQPATVAAGWPGNRAERIASHVETQLRREETAMFQRSDIRTATRETRSGAPASGNAERHEPAERLGSSWRRTARHSSVAAQARDSGA